jgi:outer membrane protein assembly factor BamB
VPIESFLLAIDPKTGKTVYKQSRPSPARVESREAYATPIPHVRDGRKELLVVGGDVLTGHEPGSGKELWRWGTWNTDHRQPAWRLVPSVVVGGDVALVCAPKRAPVFAVKLGLQGELDDSALVWKSQGRPNPVSSDVPTPAYYRGYAYVLSDVEPALSKVDPKDGTVVWTTPMPREHLWRASPTAADGKIWCLNHNGLVVVVDAGDGKIVHRAAMGEEDDDSICSSIIVAYGSLFIRTNSKLFCVGG